MLIIILFPGRWNQGSVLPVIWVVLLYPCQDWYYCLKVFADLINELKPSISSSWNWLLTQKVALHLPQIFWTWLINLKARRWGRKKLSKCCRSLYKTNGWLRYFGMRLQRVFFPPKPYCIQLSFEPGPVRFLICFLMSTVILWGGFGTSSSLSWMVQGATAGGGRARDSSHWSLDWEAV